MERPRGFPRRFRFPWRSAAQIRRDVEDEVAFHLATKIEALQGQGLGLEEAHEEALRQFGDLDASRERLVAAGRRGERRSRLVMMLDDVVRDTRLAWRSLRRTPAFTVVAVAVLALGIGVVSGAVNLVNVYALKPLLIEQPGRIRGVFAVHAQDPGGRYFSYPEYVQIRERVRSFSSLAAQDLLNLAGVEEGDVTRRVMVAFVSANYFETLGVPPAQGRGFTLAEERGEEPAAVVVSHDFWVRNGEDPNLLGSVVRVNGQPLVVVGITERGFTGTSALLAPDVWAPLAAMERIAAPEGGAPPSLGDPRDTSLILFGRLSDGASATEAQSELGALAARIDANLRRDGTAYDYVLGELARISITPEPNADEGLVGGVEVLVPMALSVVVLLVACVNLANMFLARGASRRTEMAIRQSLGSGRARLVRQLLTEGLLLATLGGAAGLLWSYWATSWIVASLAEVVPQGMRIAVDTRPDVRVLLATAATCVVAALIFGLGPAWRVTGSDVLTGLKEGAGAIASSRRGRRAVRSGGNVLIAGQIALSLAALIAGALFLRSALAAAGAVPQLNLDSLVVELDASLAGYDDARSRAVYDRVLERVRALPEVESAAMASLLPASGITHGTSVQPAGLPPGESGSFALYSVISDDYFTALGLPILRGRDFSRAEATSGVGTQVAIIDEPLARRLFPGSDPLGRYIGLGSSGRDGKSTIRQIVGVAPGTPGDDFDPAPSPHVYVPFGQAYTADMHMLVDGGEGSEAAALLPAIRDEIRRVDASLPVLRLTTMREVRDDNWRLWFIRIAGRLFTLLGVLALLIAMVGLYGVKAFLVSRRTREIGVRMALGATRAAVLRQMMRESMTATCAGLAAGFVLAFGAGRVLASLLYEVGATDPWAFIGPTAFLAASAAVASWLPVRKALRTEPSAALRHE